MTITFEVGMNGYQPSSNLATHANFSFTIKLLTWEEAPIGVSRLSLVTMKNEEVTTGTFDNERTFYTGPDRDTRIEYKSGIGFTNRPTTHIIGMEFSLKYNDVQIERYLSYRASRLPDKERSKDALFHDFLLIQP